MKHLNLGAPLATVSFGETEYAAKSIELKISAPRRVDYYDLGIEARLEGGSEDPGIEIREAGEDAIAEYARGWTDGGYYLEDGRDGEA